MKYTNPYQPPTLPERNTMTFFDRNIRLSALIAFDDALMADAEMTIVYYVNGAILPWKDYPSMLMRSV